MALKIVHISFEDMNGAGLCAYRICKSQRDMGVDSRLVVLNKTKKDKFIIGYGQKTFLWYRIINKVRRILNILNDDCRILNLSIEHETIYNSPLSHIDLTKLDVVRNADIIHLHWVGYILDYPSFFAVFKDKPIVWTLHDENMFYGIAHYSRDVLPENLLEKKYYSIKYASIKTASSLGVVFLSKMLKDKFGNHDMIKGCKQTIIHNSVDTKLYKIQAKDAARKRLGIDAETKLFAFCAANIFDKRKGLSILSETIFRMNPEYKILAIGNNALRSTKEMPNVFETGSINTAEELSWAFSAADYYVMPSYQEAFAQTPIEAMACGLPVIAFPCSGTEELITLQNGIRCEGFSSEALEDGLRLALGRKYNANETRLDVINRFSPELIAIDYMKFYENILGNNKEKAS